MEDRTPSMRDIAVGDLFKLLERFLDPAQLRADIEAFARKNGRSAYAPNETVDRALASFSYELLVPMLGESGALLVLSFAVGAEDMRREDVLRLFDETVHEIQFNRELLRATIEHLSQGVSVVDKDLRLIAWNLHYIELFQYPPELVAVGVPIENLIRFNARRGLLGSGGGDEEEKVARRIAHMREGGFYMHERELPNGMVIEIRGNPMPGGGFVTSYSDVTAYKRAQQQLQINNDTLESRVAERTQALTDANAALSQAKLAAEKANQAKTRFLASASHDLVQPLNAARLFVAALDRKGFDERSARMIDQIGNSLTAAESLLGALLDISRLDAEAQELRAEHFPLRHVLDPLAAEFAALAHAAGLSFDIVPSRAIVHTDPRLLRRVLQNFLSNAVRYTRQGRILMGCRRVSGGLRIEVWDTGPGIPEDKRTEIFEEFRRLEGADAVSDRGLGLGLAITERLARLLGHPLSLRSWLGKGSVFSITVPIGRLKDVPVQRISSARGPADLVAGIRVLCLDNEPAVLEGMQALLSGWGCEVIAVRNGEQGIRDFERSGHLPDLALLDYHLDEPESGIDIAEQLLLAWKTEVPIIIITADHTQEAKAAAELRGFALLPKPVKPAALRALMSRTLASRELTVDLPSPGNPGKILAAAALRA